MEDYIYWFWTFFIIRVKSMILAGFEMEFLLILVNSFQLLALVIRSSILDVAGLLDPALFNVFLLQARL